MSFWQKVYKDLCLKIHNYIILVVSVRFWILCDFECSVHEWPCIRENGARWS